MDVTVIAPVLNEQQAIRPLIEALLSQTMAPAEIVVADGGSTDGTRAILDELASKERRLVVVDGPGGISENRNAAIAAATSDIVACTDAGCVPYPDWLERLTAPFAEGAAFVAGFYRPVGHNARSTCAGLSIMTVLEEVDPSYFIPAGNSQAFRKAAWQQVGGFPEGMVAAEDTLFGERMIAAGFHPVFAGDAVVRWTPPPGIAAMIRKSFRWGRADGGAGLRGRVYSRLMGLYWGTPVAVTAAGFVSPWLVPLAAAPLAATVVRRTRYKYRWADGPSKYVLIPIAHLLQIWTQSLGWGVARLSGRLRRS